MGLLGAIFGSNKTSQATTTSTSSTSNTQQIDNSQAFGDGSTGINGAGNVVDNRVANNTEFTDVSNRSTNFSDTSNRSVTNTTVSTDFGAVNASISGIGATAKFAIENNGGVVLSAIDSLKAQSTTSVDIFQKALDFASNTVDNAKKQTTDIFGYAQKSIESSAAAYKDASTSPDNQTFKLLAVAVVGIAAVSFLGRK